MKGGDYKVRVSISLTHEYSEAAHSDATLLVVSSEDALEDDIGLTIKSLVGSCSEDVMEQLSRLLVREARMALDKDKLPED